MTTAIAVIFLMVLEAARNGKHLYYEKPIGCSSAPAKVLRDCTES